MGRRAKHKDIAIYPLGDATIHSSERRGGGGNRGKWERKEENKGTRVRPTERREQRNTTLSIISFFLGEQGEGALAFSFSSPKKYHDVSGSGEGGGGSMRCG